MLIEKTDHNIQNIYNIQKIPTITVIASGNQLTDFSDSY